METGKRIGRILLNILIPALGIVLVFWLGPKVLGFFMPFALGGLIALIANPVARFLEKHIKLGRKHSSAIIIIGALALVVLGGYFLIVALGREIMAFVKAAPDLFAELQLEFQQIGANFSRLIAALPANIQESLAGITSNLSEYAGSLVASIGEPTLGAVGRVTKSLPSLLVGTVVTLVSAYLFLSDKEGVSKRLQSIMPKTWLKALKVVKNNIWRIVAGYFAAQFKIMLVVLVVLYIGFKILGVHYSFVIALLTAILDFLPVFGTGFVLWPWAVFEVLSGDFGQAVGLMVIYVASQGFHQAVQPKMVGDSMDMNPLYTLFLLYLGFRFYGIGGMIIAVPIGMIVEELYKAGMFNGLITNVKLLGKEIRLLRGLPQAEENEEE